MVKKHARAPREEEPGLKALRSATICLERLEERLEAGLMFLQAVSHGSPTPTSAQDAGEPCGCLGTLCQCDGHDCVGVCDLHCIVDYA